VAIEAELKRRNTSGVLVPWVLNDDGSENVVDGEARSQLTTLVASMADQVAASNAISSNTTNLTFNPIEASSHGSNALLAAVVTLAPPTGATKLLIQAFGQNVRYTLSGTNPTATLGFQLKAGDGPVLIPILSNTQIKLIEEVATANIQYQWCI